MSAKEACPLPNSQNPKAIGSDVLWIETDSIILDLHMKADR
jgi:hypothetical protein